jgi:hypothetical protein
MQFSLRQLLMVFPYFLIMWGVCYYFHPGHQLFIINKSHLNEKLLSDIQFTVDRTRQVFSKNTNHDEHVIQFIQAGKQSNDYLEPWFNQILPFERDQQTQAMLDYWRRPIQIRRNVTNDDGIVLPLGFDSFGPDGISLSNGDDEDDVCSWTTAAIRRQDARYENSLKASSAIVALIVTPLSMLLYHFLKKKLWGKPTVAEKETSSA